MKFAIISHAPLSLHNGKMYTYAPYGREMNIWLKYVSEVIFVCPVETYGEDQLLIALNLPQKTRHLVIPDFNLLNWKSRLKAIPAIMVCMVQICRGMILADHIHLRTPGNIGLLGCFIQILFPGKKKTAKYAGNWDWKSRQPFTYRLQQKILQNTTFTHHMQALVYGHWPGATKNVLPFFTASYSIHNIEDSPARELNGKIMLLFVGTFHEGKQPLTSVQVAMNLHKNGIPVELNMFGNGPEFEEVHQFVNSNQLQSIVRLHGNQPADIVKQFYQKSHFLVFISKSEGWPKVVAESMFWGCVPITTAVSCVPEMVDFGKRGTLVSGKLDEITGAIQQWINHPHDYKKASEAGMTWSRQYTLEVFDQKIKALL